MLKQTSSDATKATVFVLLGGGAQPTNGLFFYLFLHILTLKKNDTDTYAALTLIYGISDPFYLRYLNPSIKMHYDKEYLTIKRLRRLEVYPTLNVQDKRSSLLSSRAAVNSTITL